MLEVKFLDEKKCGVEIRTFTEPTFYLECFNMSPHYGKTNEYKSCVNIKSNLEVMDFLTKNSLEPLGARDWNVEAKSFHTKVMKALFKFVNKNRDIFYG